MLNVEFGGDCLDTSVDVHPDQTSFFDIDRGDGSFDYNCDGNEEEVNSQLASCDNSWYGTCDMDGDGWNGGVPACGDQGTYVENDDHCSWSGVPVFSTCQVDGGLFPYSQSCR
jgi:hypothetical protein